MNKQNHKKTKISLIVILILLLVALIFIIRLGCKKHVCEVGDSQNWVQTETHHYHNCYNEDCSEKLDYQEHTFNKNKKCTVCNYVTSNLLWTEIDSDVYEITNSNIYRKVSNTVNKYNFEGTLTLAQGASYTVYQDQELTLPVQDDIILEEGNNTFFVVVENKLDKQIYKATIYRRKICQVTFNTNGGHSIANQYVEEEDYVLEPTVTKAGYNFVSWDYDFTVPVANDITISATWSIIDYPILYNLNEGTNNNDNPQIYNVEQTIKLSNPTKEGYVFDGWYKEQNFVNKVDQIDQGNYGEVNLYAKWKDVGEGKSISFGYYPQSEVTDAALIKTLNESAGELPTESNANLWTSYNYAISQTVKHFMWYIDITNNGCKYRGVYFTQYRPSDTKYTGTGNNSQQDDNGYNINKVYWFKYEPIVWEILKNNNDGTAYVISSIVVDAQNMLINRNNRTIDGTTVYANNYEHSELRTWLNDTFYNTAFRATDKSYIIKNTVDNSTSSTGYDENKYACNNTQDNVTLFSKVEAIDYINSNNVDGLYASDYAKAQGYDFEMGSLMTRSPGASVTYAVVGYCLAWQGFYLYNVRSATTGIMPVVKVDLQAISSANQYTVKYVVGDSTYVRNMVNGGKLEKPNIQKVGYQIDGWYKDSNYLQPWDFNTDEISGDKTLYAKQIPCLNTVVFDGNGATSGTMQNLNLKTGESQNLPTNLYTRDHYRFVSWSRQSDGIGLNYTDGEMFTMGNASKYTLYAIWEEVEYTLIENVNNQTKQTTFTIKNLPLTLQTPTIPDGYTFLGWYLNPDYSGDVVTSITSDLLKQINQNTIQLYAKFEQI